MAEPPGSSSVAGVPLVLFGPQVTDYDKPCFDWLQSMMSDESVQRWVLDVVSQLRPLWRSFSQRIPQLQGIPGDKHLADLEKRFTSEPLCDAGYNLPNISLTPLVVLTHLVQCWCHLQSGKPTDGTYPECPASLGFCTGILSAFALSASSSREEIFRHGSTAVRLAMVAGAIVDAQEVSDAVYGKASSFAVAWSTDKQRKTLDNILDQFPEAYISVLYDKRRATVTTAEATSSSIVKQLNDDGIVTSEVSLRGRFHYKDNQGMLEQALQFCDSDSTLQLPDASAVKALVYNNSNGKPIPNGKLHHLALKAILVEQANWFETFAKVQPSYASLISLGPRHYIPPTMQRELGARVVMPTNLNRESVPVSANAFVCPNIQSTSAYLNADDGNDIAVVGMAIRTAGADDLNEFWEVNRRGESQHVEVPASRFGFQTLWREVEKDRKWYGNFMADVDAFDHKFFKKSPREAANMDPQQRLMMQAAYQAVEQSGYFNEARPHTQVGCYIGTCGTDYEHNIACHPANAFTATGNLRSFIPGKISHYFGWTGPGMTLDTACSASAVAVHTACRAILSGECPDGALAGGVGLMTNPVWFQNLAGASFLSPTGQCKPFDQEADGYCRGEAIACVFLKKMSRAIADGNQIFGCIPSTGVLQNQNCTPLFVPNSPSLSHLFREVMQRARLEPEQISVVEAHGTGTPVGDPAEYESIRLALVTPARTKPLQLGSVKGLVGHTEATSGMLSLIKVILMMQEGYTVPQASHKVMSSHIDTSSMITVPRAITPWEGSFKAALINNYGASGSNASMVVTHFSSSAAPAAGSTAGNRRYPFWITGFNDQAILNYCQKLAMYLWGCRTNNKPITIDDVCFSVARQSNRSLQRGLLFSSDCLTSLETKLEEFTQAQTAASITSMPPGRPIIMCFGGQISTFIGLEKSVYEGVHVFRMHLDQCDAVIRSMGMPSVFPDIFSKTTVQDTVKFQTMLFAMQYSCAKCWMGCGANVAAVVGHSFGELTALCVSGALSLKDTVKLVAGRAALVRDSWGSDRGAMAAVEGDLPAVQELVRQTNDSCAENVLVNIACYNGPKSFTIAGSTPAVDKLLEINSKTASMRAKKLSVSNAFHSALVEPLCSALEKLGKDVTFKAPSIPIHFSREHAITGDQRLDANYVSEHMRLPVFFNHAVQRLAEQHPSAIWLEAGSHSTITVMAGRALGTRSDSHFQAINICKDNALQDLADATLSLWKEGARISLWQHHSLQAQSFAPLILPPYQFEKHRHWMELKIPQPARLLEAEDTTNESSAPVDLWTFAGYQDSEKRSVRFRVNTSAEKYKKFVSGHLIAQTATICPATLEVDMAIEALRSLRPELRAPNMNPQLLKMNNHVPICEDASKSVWLDCKVIAAERSIWEWQILSRTVGSTTDAETVHVTGQIQFRRTDDTDYQTEFARYERMVRHERCLDVLNCDEDADDIIQGRNIYKAFAPIVDYAEEYRGVKKVVGRGNECAGRVCKSHSGETWLGMLLSDCFSQVGGLWVNCMTDCPPTDMYIAGGCELLLRNPAIPQGYEMPDKWDVYASHHHKSAKETLTDVFVFDATNGTLVLVMLGIHYIRVSKASMAKILARLTSIAATVSEVPKAALPTKIQENTEPETELVKTTIETAPKSKAETKQPLMDLSRQVRDIIANVSGIEASDIKNDSDLADFGIDSLMGMELAREVENSLKCTLDQAELMDATNFRKFVKCIAAALNVDDGGEDSSDESLNDDATIALGSSGRETPQTTAPSSPLGGKPAELKAQALELASVDILESFGQSKMLTDQFIRDYKIDNFSDVILSKSNQLCVALVVEAFEKLGCSFRATAPGEVMERIVHAPQHGRLVQYLYQLLEKEARLINIEVGGRITRTSIPPPKKSSELLLQDLVDKYPEWIYANKLTFYAGQNLADVLTGKTDGLRVIFGTPEGRELVSALYCDHSFNLMSYNQMRDFIGRLVSRLGDNHGPLKILEMGAGTGGTTQVLAPFLASLNIPVEYTFTDLAPSMVAIARRKYKHYPFMKFAVHDIEQPPSDDLRGQHIVIASNAIHATHNLAISTKNVRAALRDDGFLMMLEMTEVIPFIEIIFGLLEGWWLFDDGRTHAVAPATQWEKDLQSAGFGHVDWTDGSLPENKIQKVIIAMSNSPVRDRLPKPEPKAQPPTNLHADDASREAQVAQYVAKYTQGFKAPQASSTKSIKSDGHCFLVTGATGSLGSHIVEKLAQREDVRQVICVNRATGVPVTTRQEHALSSRGISLDEHQRSKLKMVETDTSKALLGVAEEEYEWLRENVTHIIHNAWPMSGSRPLRAFQSQFETMKNLTGLARDAASRRPEGFRVGFELVSSIGVVGQYPLWSGKTRVPEQRMEMKSVLDNGYCEAKFVCERMLEATLQKHPDSFRPMIARLGQIAGSSRSGYWNSVEHFSFLIKSAQSLRIFPNFDGVLSWVPVDVVAGTLVDLLLEGNSQPHPIYHIDNPVGQPWGDMVRVLADALDIPGENIVPFEEWIERVRRSPLLIETDNPAGRLVDFLDHHFLRMSCGGLLLDTSNSCERSKTLAAQGPVSAEVARKYVKAWKDAGFLHH